jgi:hypothetical protein
LSSAAAAAAVGYHENVLFVTFVSADRVAVVVRQCPTTIVKNDVHRFSAFRDYCSAPVLSRARARSRHRFVSVCQPFVDR